MFRKRLYLFPVALALYLPLTFIITYAMAVHFKHVEPVFPYMSDTGNVPPESGVFALLVNIYAVLVAWCIYLRYGQIRLVYHQAAHSGQLEPHSAQWRTVRCNGQVNKVCPVLGLILAGGMSTVANFQEDTMGVHMTGAVMALCGATVYGWVQCYLTYHLARLSGCQSYTPLVRLVLALLYTLGCLVLLIATKLSLDKFPFPARMIKKWTPAQPGYTEHLWATFAELFLVIVSSAFFLTFAEDLKTTQLNVRFAPVSVSDESASNSRSSSSSISSISSLPSSAGEEDSIALGAVDTTKLAPVDGSVDSPDANKTLMHTARDYGALE